MLTIAKVHFVALLREMMRYRETGTRPTYNNQLRCVILSLLCYSLCMLLVACGTSNGQGQSGSTATATVIKPAATPTAVVPTITTPSLTYKGHTGPVIGVAWSPDGKNIASCGNDGTVQIWQASTGQMLWKAPVSRYTFAVAWSPNGQQVAAAGADSTIAIFDATTGHPLTTISNNAGFIEGLAWSPDGKNIASGGDDKIVHVWDATTGKTLLQYQGHSDIIFKIAWSPDGSSIASASADGTVQVWQAHKF
jgi:WD40 repeat protein